LTKKEQPSAKNSTVATQKPEVKKEMTETKKSDKQVAPQKVVAKPSVKIAPAESSVKIVPAEPAVKIAKKEQPKIDDEKK